MTSYWTNWRIVRAELAQLENVGEEGEEDVLMAGTDTISDEYQEYDMGNETESDVVTDVNSFSSEISDDGEGVNALSDDLCEWATKHKLTRAAFSDLLEILRIHGHDLPKDPRTLLNVPTQIETVAKCGGRYIYFGIENGIRQVLKVLSINQIPDTLSLVFNIDGLPLFRSSPWQFWPILCKALCQVFTVSLFYGKKPEPVEEFLRDFIREMTNLIENGIIHENKVINIKLSCFVCDAPARSLLKGNVGHTGYHSCERCIVKGVWFNHRMTFLELDEEPRTDTNFSNFHYAGTHQLRRSPLIDLNVKCVSQFPLDYMHLVCLGVVRRTLNFLKTGPRLCKLSQQQINDISEHLSSFKRCMPSEFVRQPRELSDLDRWKATELRSFLLYTGPVVLKPVLPRENYHHFICLSIAVSILLNCNDEYRKQFRGYAKALLRHFVSESPKYYSQSFVVYNVHALIHLVDDLQEERSLNDINAFPFENYLQSLKKMVRNGNNPIAQVAKRLHQLKAHGKRNGKKCFCKISIHKPNNCFYLSDDKIIILTAEKGDGKFQGHLFKIGDMDSFFNEPENSKHFKICFLPANLKGKKIEMNSSLFVTKAVVLPYKNGQVIFPLLHEIERTF